jgi:Ca2+:H+ antiporter
MNLEALRSVSRWQRATLAFAVAMLVAVAVARAAGADDVAQFVLAGLSLAGLAAVIGQAMDQISERMGPSATGVLQSTLGNLPELFVGYFALKDGLTGLVQAALVGSVLGNAVLVMGLAFVAGGARHGIQRFDPEQPRMYASLLLLVVSALLIPTLAVHLDTPAAPHAVALSDVCAVVLLAVYALSVPYFLRSGARNALPVVRPADAAAVPGSGGSGDVTDPRVSEGGNPDGGRVSGLAGRGRAVAAVDEGPRVPGDDVVDPIGEAVWPLNLAVLILAVASISAALAADWFVAPLQTASETLGLSETFTGLVVVALASNAVENAVGVRFALGAKPDYAISTALNSPLQVALLLTPVLVLLSHVVGPSQLTLVFSPMLVATLAMSAVVVTFVIYDGEYTWLEGAALVALYGMIASAFWWG